MSALPELAPIPRPCEVPDDLLHPYDAAVVNASAYGPAYLALHTALVIADRPMSAASLINSFRRRIEPQVTFPGSAVYTRHIQKWIVGQNMATPHHSGKNGTICRFETTDYDVLPVLGALAVWQLSSPVSLRAYAGDPHNRSSTVRPILDQDSSRNLTILHIIRKNLEKPTPPSITKEFLGYVTGITHINPYISSLMASGLITKPVHLANYEPYTPAKGPTWHLLDMLYSLRDPAFRQHATDAARTIIGDNRLLQQLLCPRPARFGRSMQEELIDMPDSRPATLTAMTALPDSSPQRMAEQSLPAPAETTLSEASAVALPEEVAVAAVPLSAPEGLPPKLKYFMDCGIIEKRPVQNGLPVRLDFSQLIKINFTAAELRVLAKYHGFEAHLYGRVIPERDIMPYLRCRPADYNRYLYEELVPKLADLARVNQAEAAGTKLSSSWRRPRNRKPR